MMNQIVKWKQFQPLNDSLTPARCDECNVTFKDEETRLRGEFSDEQGDHQADVHLPPLKCKLKWENRTGYKEAV